MSLFSRITVNDGNKIGVHRLGAGLREWAAGGVTRQQLIDRFALNAGEIAELDALKASYDALGTGNATAAFTKAAWTQRMEDVFLLCETGDYTEAQAKTRLGF